MHEQDLLARVYSRIHWDKILVGSTLELQVQADGTVILRGAMTDKVSKERAILLARDTVGISRVVDEMTVLPPAAGDPRVALTGGVDRRSDHHQAAQVITAPPATVIETPAATVITKP